ncbi:hypothetical protein FQA39_LY09903 [Lamprigera yunnana]|nr:hypothetical protein FQA39_LY09903 [Lamprigera yunnana]
MPFGMSRFLRPLKVLYYQRNTIHHLNFIHDSVDELTKRYECFFCRKDIDGWDVRQAMNDITGMEMIPDPRIINSALYACRRVNEYSVAIRFLEIIRHKCVISGTMDTVYPYILQEIGSTINELGIETPEGLGYDKPELYLIDAEDCYPEETST